MRLLRLCYSRVPGIVFFLFFRLLDLGDETLNRHNGRGGGTDAHGRTSRKSDADVVAVSHLELPQTHITARHTTVRGLVEVLIGVARVEPGRAEVAKVRLAAVADHMVAAVRLLRGDTAGRTRRGVHSHVFEGGQFLGGELNLVAARDAAEELAVP
jgi:hypothetical protein